MNKYRAKHFFTLIELLLVVAIIAILIGIVMPSTMQVKGKSIKSACMSNLRQIGIALNMYADENNERYPYCTMKPSDPPTTPADKSEANMPGIAPTLLPYLKDKKVFLCPGDINETYYRAEGVSYEWQSSLYNGWNVAKKQRVEELFKDLPKLPVMFDFDNFHGKSGSKTAKNFLYPYGNVSGEMLP